MNVKADEYVAVFGILAQEGETVVECGENLRRHPQGVSAELKPLGHRRQELCLSTSSPETRSYRFEVLDGDVARRSSSVSQAEEERLDSLPRLRPARQAPRAAGQGADLRPRQGGLHRERRRQGAGQADWRRRPGSSNRKRPAMRSCWSDEALPPAQVYAERPAIHYPLQLYDSSSPRNRKGSTTASTGAAHRSHGPQDPHVLLQRPRRRRLRQVINPVLVEPAVQFTLYLKVKYAIESGPAK